MKYCTPFYQYFCGIYIFTLLKSRVVFSQKYSRCISTELKNLPYKFPFPPRKIIHSFSSVWMNRYIFRIISLNAHFYLPHLLRMLCSVADVSGHDTWAWNLSVWYLWWNSLMKHPNFQLVVLCARNLAAFWLCSRACNKGLVFTVFRDFSRIFDKLFSSFYKIALVQDELDLRSTRFAIQGKKQDISVYVAQLH